jgi:hypothetical protein
MWFAEKETNRPKIMDANQSFEGYSMPISDNELDSEQKLLWSTWQEKSRRADRLTEKRVAILGLAVGVLLLGCILYYALRAKASLDPDRLQRGLVYACSSSRIA